MTTLVIARFATIPERAAAVGNETQGTAIRPGRRRMTMFPGPTVGSRTRRSCVALLVAFLPAFSMAAPAEAQPASAIRQSPGKRSEATVRKTSVATGYSYAFDDDTLDALPNSTSSLRIVVRDGAARVLLIRPRVQFVPEMLKSVEAL